MSGWQNLLVESQHVISTNPESFYHQISPITGHFYVVSVQDAGWVLMAYTKDQVYVQLDTAVIYFPERIICTRHRNIYSVCTVKKGGGCLSIEITSKCSVFTLLMARP
jgi:hypothetical protein